MRSIRRSKCVSKKREKMYSSSDEVSDFRGLGSTDLGQLVVQENEAKEHGTFREESDTEKRLSIEEKEDTALNTSNGCEEPEESSQLLTEPISQLHEEKEKEKSSRFFDDEKQSQYERNTYEVSSDVDKMSLDLEQREQKYYERQLVQLQRQLVETMIKERQTSDHLKKLENLKLDVILRELEEEKQKTIELTEMLEFMKKRAKYSALQRSNASRRGIRRSRVLETSDNQKKMSLGEDTERMKADDTQGKKSDEPRLSHTVKDNSVFDFDEGHFAMTSGRSLQENEALTSIFVKLQEYKKMIMETIADRLWDFVNEEPETENKKDNDGDAISVITLKENINRCKSGVQSITRLFEPVVDILSWTRPLASFTMFLVYMFAVVHGYLLPLVILLVIVQLSSNYFYASGFAAKLGCKGEEELPATDEKKLSDRFQLVLQVAKKVQNTLGKVADSLEKIKNLLTWQHPATNQLYIALCFAFVASVVLDGPTLFMLAAVGVGVKMFITRPIFTKFPKVKKRYDSMADIWNELPTDADLSEQKKREFQLKAYVEDELLSPKSPKLNSPSFFTSWTNFCERMKVPLTEYPMPSWEEGQRCTLSVKDQSTAIQMKNGKLFLTQNYLCFERYKFGKSKNVVIKLEDLVNVAKYNEINTIPGTGMSIKIEVRASNKSYIFGGLLTRNELFESLIAACKSAKVPWTYEVKK